MDLEDYNAEQQRNVNWEIMSELKSPHKGICLGDQNHFAKMTLPVTWEVIFYLWGKQNTFYYQTSAKRDNSEKPRYLKSTLLEAMIFLVYMTHNLQIN